MQDSEVEWIGKIPQNWQLDRLKDIVSLRDEKSTEKSDLEDYLELEDIEQGTGRLFSVRNTLTVESAVMKFYKYDVLFGKLRPYLQKYYLATFDGKCTGEILAFKPEKIDPKFLLYFIASDGFIKICTAMSYGAKMPRVNYPKQLALLPICLPPTNQQLAIANYLEEQCGKLDAIIAIKQQQIKTLDALRQSIIYQAVTKGLDASVPLVDSGVEWIKQTPLDWRKDKIFRLAEFISSGGTPRSTNEDFYGGEIMWVQTGDLDNGFIHESSKQITLEGLHNSSAKIFPKDTLLIAMYGATIGKLGILAREATTNQACCAIYVTLKLNIKFTFYIFMAMKDYLVFQSYGGGQPNISQEIIKQQYIYYPSFEEQQRIATHLDQETQRLNKLKENLNQQITTLEAYKKSLIYECVTGKARINGGTIKTS